MLSHCHQIIKNYNPARMMSLDLLRGLTIFTMILVNNPGSWGNLYSPLAHAAWHGWTITDLVFPFFLFIVGISIALSNSSSNPTSSDSTKPLGLDSRVFKQILIRSVKLVLLGWLLGLSYYNFYNPNFDWINDRLLSLRWFGVLERIAIVYFVCAICFRVLTTWRLVLLSIFLLASYWAAMMLFPYTDNEGTVYTGMLLPGNNLAAFIDHNLFGIKHLYHKSTLPFASDPEGLLTTVPALVNCLIGIIIGKQILLKVNKPKLEENTDANNAIKLQIFKLVLIAFPMLVIAYLSSIWFPFNKNLWSPSYVLLSSALAILMLALSRWLIDLRGIKLWSAPFLVFGSNAIALFMISGFAARLLGMIKIEGVSLKSHIYSIIQLSTSVPKLNSLLFAIVFMIAMYCPIYLMYKKKIFWKV